MIILVVSLYGNIQAFIDRAANPYCRRLLRHIVFVQHPQILPVVYYYSYAERALVTASWRESTLLSGVN